MAGWVIPRLEYHSAPLRRQRRWTVAIRAILVLPHYLALALAFAALAVVTFLAWFVAVFTGRNPFANFALKVLAYDARVSAYANLLTDRYPKFSFDDPDFPVKIDLQPGKMGRASIFFRIVLAFPVGLVSAALSFGNILTGFSAWCTTLIRGELPEALHRAISATQRFRLRVTSYQVLLQGVYPQGLFGDQDLVVPPSHGTETNVPPEGTESEQVQTPEPAMPATMFDAASEDDLAYPPPTLPVVGEGEPSSRTGHGWSVLVTRGARFVLITQLVVGSTLWVLDRMYQNSHPIVESSGMADQSWSTSYYESVATVTSDAMRTRTEMQLTPTDWPVIGQACERLNRDLTTMGRVPQYPDKATNAALISGYVLVFKADITCSQMTVPQRLSEQLPGLSRFLGRGSSEMASFLNRIPTP